MKKIAVIFLVIIIMCSALITFAIYAVNKADRENQEKYSQWCQKQFDEQLAEIKSGKRSSLSFYEFRNTDSLLKQAANVPEISGIVLQLTDVSDQGLQSISSMPNLQKLVVYGGSGKVSDRGFVFMKNIKSLKTLELINTEITDQSLPDMKELPNLHTLTLYRDGFREKTFTDAGLNHLKNLPKLKKLYLSGGWASEKAVDELRQALPDCRISTDGGETEF